MPKLVLGKFRTAVARLPAARQLHFLETRGRFLASPVTRRLVALLICARALDYASRYSQIVVGGSRRQAMRRTFLPCYRYWESYLPLIFQETAVLRPRWLDRLTVSGLDRIFELRAAGTPVILAVPHLSFTTAAIAYGLASQGIPVTINTVAPTLFSRIPGVEAVDPDEVVRSFLALREGSVLIYGADVAGPGVVCRFFGRYVSFPSFFADVSKRTGAAIMVVSGHGFRSGNVRVALGETFFAGQRNADAVTQDIVLRLEAAIRSEPYEWFPAGPFLTHMSFCESGSIPTLVCVLGDDATSTGKAIQKLLNTYRGFAVDLEAHDCGDLATLSARLRASNHELLVLIQPALGSEIDEVPLLINHFLRFPTDWVAFEPEPNIKHASDYSVTSFSFSLIKARVLQSLIERGIERLDSESLKSARHMGWFCHHIPSTTDLLRAIDRSKRGRVPINDLIR